MSLGYLSNHLIEYLSFFIPAKKGNYPIKQASQNKRTMTWNMIGKICGTCQLLCLVVEHWAAHGVSSLPVELSCSPVEEPQEWSAPSMWTALQGLSRSEGRNFFLYLEGCVCVCAGACMCIWGKCFRYLNGYRKTKIHQIPWTGAFDSQEKEITETIVPYFTPKRMGLHPIIELPTLVKITI